MTGRKKQSRFLACLKREFFRNLGGRIPVDVTFTTRQVVDSEEHRLLMAPEKFCFEWPEEAVQATFIRKVIQSLTIDGHYMILLAFDTYDALPDKG